MNGQLPPHSHQINNPSATAQNIAGAQPYFQNVSIAQLGELMTQSRGAAYDRHADNIAGMAPSTAPHMPTDWLRRNVEILEALKDVMETLAAQEAVVLDAYKDKPIQKQIYLNIMRQGITAVTGTK